MYFYWESFERGFDQAIRAGDWKGVRKGSDAPLQLYDLKADLGENHNVAEKHPVVVAKLGSLVKSTRVDSDRRLVKKGKK